MKPPHIVVLGVGNILFRDEGIGIRVIERLQDRHAFPENVSLVDGGVLGLNLLGVISHADHLIVVDAVQAKGNPGDMYRLEGDHIPERIRAKNSLHQVDLVEILTLCHGLGNVPDTVILGMEPEDIGTLGMDLTVTIRAKVDLMADKVLEELDRLETSFSPKTEESEPCALQYLPKL